MQASLQGIDLDKQLQQGENESPVTSAKVITSEENLMVFGDPSQYENLSKDEKQALTDKMMGLHKRTMRTTEIGRGM